MARGQIRRCNEKRQYGNCGQWWIRNMATWQEDRWPSRCYRMKKSRDSVDCSLQICCKFNAVTWNFPSKLFCILLAFFPVVCGANLSDFSVWQSPSSKLSHLTCAGKKYGNMARQMIEQMQFDANWIHEYGIFSPNMIPESFGFFLAICSIKLSDLGIKRSLSFNLSHLSATCAGNILHSTPNLYFNRIPNT